jgi:hypothetical protein
MYLDITIRHLAEQEAKITMLQASNTVILEIFTFFSVACRSSNSITTLFGSISPILHEKIKERLGLIFLKCKNNYLSLTNLCYMTFCLTFCSHKASFKEKIK